MSDNKDNNSGNKQPTIIQGDQHIYGDVVFGDSVEGDQVGGDSTTYNIIVNGGNLSADLWNLTKPYYNSDKHDKVIINDKYGDRNDHVVGKSERKGHIYLGDKFTSMPQVEYGGFKFTKFSPMHEQVMKAAIDAHNVGAIELSALIEVASNPQ